MAKFCGWGGGIRSRSCDGCDCVKSHQKERRVVRAENGCSRQIRATCSDFFDLEEDECQKAPPRTSADREGSRKNLSPEETIPAGESRNSNRKGNSLTTSELGEIRAGLDLTLEEARLILEARHGNRSPRTSLSPSDPGGIHQDWRLSQRETYAGEGRHGSQEQRTSLTPSDPGGIHQDWRLSQRETYAAGTRHGSHRQTVLSPSGPGGTRESKYTPGETKVSTGGHGQPLTVHEIVEIRKSLKLTPPVNARKGSHAQPPPLTGHEISAIRKSLKLNPGDIPRNGGKRQTKSLTPNETRGIPKDSMLTQRKAKHAAAGRDVRTNGLAASPTTNENVRIHKDSMLTQRKPKPGASRHGITTSPTTNENGATLLKESKLSPGGTEGAAAGNGVGTNAPPPPLTTPTDTPLVIHSSSVTLVTQKSTIVPEIVSYTKLTLPSELPLTATAPDPGGISGDGPDSSAFDVSVDSSMSNSGLDGSAPASVILEGNAGGAVLNAEGIPVPVELYTVGGGTDCASSGVLEEISAQTRNVGLDGVVCILVYNPADPQPPLQIPLRSSQEADAGRVSMESQTTDFRPSLLETERGTVWFPSGESPESPKADKKSKKRAKTKGKAGSHQEEDKSIPASGGGIFSGMDNAARLEALTDEMDTLKWDVGAYGQFMKGLPPDPKVNSAVVCQKLCDGTLGPGKNRIHQFLSVFPDTTSKCERYCKHLKDKQRRAKSASCARSRKPKVKESSLDRKKEFKDFISKFGFDAPIPPVSNQAEVKPKPKRACSISHPKRSRTRSNSNPAVKVTRSKNKKSGKCKISVNVLPRATTSAGAIESKGGKPRHPSSYSKSTTNMSPLPPPPGPNGTMSIQITFDQCPPQISNCDYSVRVRGRSLGRKRSRNGASGGQEPINPSPHPMKPIQTQNYDPHKLAFKPRSRSTLAPGPPPYDSLYENSSMRMRFPNDALFYFPLSNSQVSATSPLQRGEAEEEKSQGGGQTQEGPRKDPTGQAPGQGCQGM